MQRQKKAKPAKPKTQKQNTITLLFSIPIVLTIVGLFFIFEASSVAAFRNLGNSFYFLRLQAMWFVLGVGAMIFFSLFDYKKLYYLSFPALLTTIVLLVLVLIPGIGTTVSGARRWINLGFVTFQPTELAKFSVILYLSSWFLHKEKQRFYSFLLLLGFIISLIMIQPDMGTAIILFSLFILIYFISGESIKHLFYLAPFAVGVFLLFVKTSSYRMQRFLTFFDPSVDPQGIGYHVRQIFISLSAGGLLGRGFSASRQKYQFLPEAHTDSIFAIIGEEVGFFGSVLIICAYIALLVSMYRIAINTKDRFGFLLVGSVFGLLSIQVIINLFAMTGLAPLTGIPLPFISYGGSSLLVFFALIGIVINIARR